MEKGKTLIVVGAGVFGLTCVLELLKRGSLYKSIHVFDKGSIPHSEESSSYDVSKIVRSDYARDDFYVQLGNRAIKKWLEWNKEFNTTIYHDSGLVMLKKAEMKEGSYERDSFEKIKTTATRLSLEDPQNLLNTRFKAWSATKQYKDGYFNPNAGWVESAKILTILYNEINSKFPSTVTWHPNTLIQSLIINQNHQSPEVQGVLTMDKQSFKSDQVLLSCGAWTSNLLTNLTPQLPAHLIESMFWASGQPVIHLQLPKELHLKNSQSNLNLSEHNFPVFFADISLTGWYGFPVLENGLLKLGHHSAGIKVPVQNYPKLSNLFPTEFVNIGFRQFLSQSLPMLKDCPVVFQRLCLYTDTFDGDFLITPVPSVQNLIVGTGGSGHAFKFCPVLGEIIADVVEGKHNKDAERFKWRVPEPKKIEEQTHTIGGWSNRGGGVQSFDQILQSSKL